MPSRLKILSASQAWWHMPIAPELRRITSAQEFRANRGSITRPHLKKKKKTLNVSSKLQAQIYI
jgi:hypothetical protein